MILDLAFGPEQDAQAGPEQAGLSGPEPADQRKPEQTEQENAGAHAKPDPKEYAGEHAKPGPAEYSGEHTETGPAEYPEAERGSFPDGYPESANRKAGAPYRPEETYRTDLPCRPEETYSEDTKPEKHKKPFFKRVWFWVVVVIVIILIAAGVSGGGDSQESSDSETTQTEQDADDTEDTGIEDEADAEEEEQEEEEEEAEAKVMQIEASYNGDTEAGTVLDEDNSGIKVTAYYDNGSSETVWDWTVETAKTLKAGKSSKITISYEGVSTELKVKCTTISEAEYKEKCKTYDYEDLARTPDDYIGYYMKIYGEVIQVQESGDSVVLRVATENSGYGYYDDVVMVYYTYKDGDVHILEDDMITLWGLYGGTYTYESVMGSDITVPLLYAEYFALDD